MSTFPALAVVRMRHRKQPLSGSQFAIPHIAKDVEVRAGRQSGDFQQAKTGTLTHISRTKDR